MRREEALQEREGEPDSATQNAVVHIPGRGPAEREKDAPGAPRGSST